MLMWTRKTMKQGASMHIIINGVCRIIAYEEFAPEKRALKFAGQKCRNYASRI